LISFQARVAKLADAPDLKSFGIAVSITSEAYLKIPKTTLKPTTGADLSPMIRPKAGESSGKLIGDK
jgi:hypothetical protein